MSLSCKLYVTRCFRHWRKWLTPLVMFVYAVIILIVLPFLVFELTKHEAVPSVQAWFLGGLFVIMAIPISFWEILQHLIHYTQPHLQKYIIRILWMVPVYALDSWLALTFPKLAIYFDTARGCYEAYVIYNFMMFLLSFLHLELNLRNILEEKDTVKPLFPCCCLKPWNINWNLIEGCKNGILQYTLVKPLTTLISFACEMGGVYGEGSFLPTVAYPYLAVLDNISQFIAMYSLIMFYRAFHEELKPMKPLPKFLCIKSVVFFSFFQSFLISILVSAGVITSSFTTESKSGGDVGKSIQDFLICFEMFIAALAHKYAFSYFPYVNLAAQQIPCCQSFLAMWDLSDVQQDVTDHISYVGNKVKKSFTRSGNQTSPTTLSGSYENENQQLVNKNNAVDGSYQSTSNSLGEEDVPSKTVTKLSLDVKTQMSVNSSVENASDVVDDLVDLTKDLVSLKKDST